MSRYNPKIVSELMEQAYKIATPYFEYQFFPLRKWKFDMAWPVIFEPAGRPGENAGALALEVQGGIFRRGRHTRGAALKQEHEKLNMAAVLGWRVLFITPDEIYKKATMEMIKEALHQ